MKIQITITLEQDTIRVRKAAEYIRDAFQDATENFNPLVGGPSAVYHSEESASEVIVQQRRKY